MGIEKIKGKVETLAGSNVPEGKVIKNRAFLTSPVDSTSFTGVAATVPKTLKDVILDLMPKKINFMVKAHKNMGEIQNQTINALGTGLVAPVFIKYNPLSDTDEDTRTYTAWRQPVSAVLAMGTQCAIVIPFNKAIERMSDIGYEHFSLLNNASLYPSEKYIEKSIKAANSGKKLSKEELKFKVEEAKSQYNKALKDMINQDKIVFNKIGVNGASTAELPKEEFKKLFEETLDELIKEERAERKNLFGDNFKFKTERGIFYFENSEAAKKTLDKISESLASIYGEAPQGVVNEQGCVAKDARKRFNQACKKIINELKQEAKIDPSKKVVNKELIKMVKEVKSRNINDTSTSRILFKKVDKMYNSLAEMSAKTSTDQISQAVIDKLNGRARAIDGFVEVLNEIKTKLKTDGITVAEAQRILDVRAGLITPDGKPIPVEDLVDTAKDSVESVEKRIQSKVSSLAGNIGDQLKKHVKSNLDGLKRWTGLFVSLAILPATCWLLNKIYPWFMAKAFPDLTNSKNKAKEEKLNQKVEVA
ncbi:MAG: hypothetical protein E7Z87_07870 [Cyanobacteria bacterium SIG26]|nr:hypothetical protein [Cyanobacteria bacterium SIG26]